MAGDKVLPAVLAQILCWKIRHNQCCHIHLCSCFSNLLLHGKRLNKPLLLWHFIVWEKPIRNFEVKWIIEPCLTVSSVNFPSDEMVNPSRSISHDAPPLRFYFWGAERLQHQWGESHDRMVTGGMWLGRRRVGWGGVWGTPICTICDRSHDPIHHTPSNE